MQEIKLTVYLEDGIKEYEKILKGYRLVLVKSSKASGPHRDHFNVTLKGSKANLTKYLEKEMDYDHSEIADTLQEYSILERLNIPTFKEFLKESALNELKISKTKR